MSPAPTQPILDLPARIGQEAADLVAAIAPGAFAVMLALVVLTLGARLIREAL